METTKNLQEIEWKKKDLNEWRVALMRTLNSAMGSLIGESWERTFWFASSEVNSACEQVKNIEKIKEELEKLNEADE